MKMIGSGAADLPLHGGRVPKWLATRMAVLSRAIVEALIVEYDQKEVIRRLADPFWFQSLGCVLGMDWHSSGITTSVISALKRGLHPSNMSLESMYVGEEANNQKKTPGELLQLGQKVAVDGDHLVRCSKLAAKIDNTAVQDGYQLYLHAFVVDFNGNWSVVQQGMNDCNGMARRYHWHNDSITSFVEEPHAAICGMNHGDILNLVDLNAGSAQTRYFTAVYGKTN